MEIQQFSATRQSDAVKPVGTISCCLGVYVNTDDGYSRCDCCMLRNVYRPTPERAEETQKVFPLRQTERCFSVDVSTGPALTGHIRPRTRIKLTLKGQFNHIPTIPVDYFPCIHEAEAPRWQQWRSPQKNTELLTLYIYILQTINSKGFMVV